MSDSMKWLQSFYLSQCNGDWEHGYGIRIVTLDNPGWSVEIHLEGTSLDGLPFDEIDQSFRSDHDWVICSVAERVFTGCGGPCNLEEILTIFRTWVENSQRA